MGALNALFIVLDDVGHRQLFSFICGETKIKARRRQIMKYILSFLGGVFVGAVAALLYAPTSGEELRAQLRDQAEAELDKVQTEFRRMQQEFSAKLDDTVAEIRAIMEQEESGEAAAEVEAADAS